MTEELTIYMQSRPDEKDARCVPMGYDGNGFWFWNGKRYEWNEGVVK